MQVDGILETCLYVDDLSEAESFYTRILGLSVFSRFENRHLFFRCGQGVFLLFNPDESVKPNGQVPSHGARGEGHVAFAMAEIDIPRWKKHLANHGIEIEKEVEWPNGGRSIYFRDPSGNSVELATPEVWQLT